MLKQMIIAGVIATGTTADARPSGENGDVVAVEVLPGWRDRSDLHVAALRISLAPGWKTYWRVPGDAGIPARFNWQMSTNVDAVRPHWPVPEIHTQFGMRSIGYTDEVVIPLHITLKDASAATRLVGDIELGVCEDVCIPAFVFVEARLPNQGVHDAQIAAALADRPMSETEASVSAVTCAIAPSDHGLALSVVVTMPEMPGEYAATVETADPTTWVAEPRLTRDGDQLIAETELVNYGDGPLVFDRSGMRMTLFAGDAAVDILGCAPAAR